MEIYIHNFLYIWNIYGKLNIIFFLNMETQFADLVDIKSVLGKVNVFPHMGRS